MQVSDIWTGCAFGNSSETGTNSFAVQDKYALTDIAQVTLAEPRHTTSALDLARAYAENIPGAYDRSQLLLRVRDLISARRDLFQQVMTAEAGFPIKDAQNEIGRALQTLTLSAEEAKRLTGEVVPFDGAPNGGGRLGFTLRVPIGIVAAITPFNAPLNTVCHKVGPAIAAGNAVILKPSDKTPLTANLLAQCFADAGAPPGAIAVLHGGADTAKLLLDAPEIGFFAFTGSTAVGRKIHAAAGLRRTQMELGSIAATIVMADADSAAAAAKCVGSTFRKAGQVCTSIQMLMVEDGIFDTFRQAFVAETKKLTFGDPADPKTDVGPMISEAAAERVMAMIEGETILAGGTRDRAVMTPTIITNPHNDARVLSEEIFGPVCCLIPISGIEEAIARINATPYGLATGLFTNQMDTAFAAARQLQVGGVHVNETCSSRVDLMPYGGVKDSGFGHEGPRYAMHEMTQERLITFSGLDG